MTSRIRTETFDGIRVVTLNRPDRRNALTPDMLDDLVETLADPGSARCLLLAGEGATFCSGFDLALCEGDPDGHTMRRLLASLSGAVRAMRRLSIPVVVAAQGGAIAGGCALLGGADLVVGDRAAKFGYPVVRLGVSPAVSGATLASLVGHGPARRLMLDPGLIDGAEAYRLGLVHLLVDQAVEVEGAARAAAKTLALKPPEAIAETRRWLDIVERGLAHDGGRGVDAGLAASIGLVGGPEERRMLKAPTPRAR